MAQNEESNERFWSEFHGPNMGYVEEQYDLYKADPEAVDPSIKKMFDEHGAPQWLSQANVSVGAEAQATSIDDVKKLTSAMKLVEAIRRFGHLEADIYPIRRNERTSNLVQAESYGLTEEDLASIPASWLWDKAPNHVENGLDVVKELKKYYSGTITFEFDHLNNEEERNWLLDLIESGKARLNLSNVEKMELLDRLAQVEGFEGFLQKTFVGQKRFSIEGLEAMVPMLDQIVKNASADKVENIMMGMAHRGRLAVLAHILGKPYDKIFSEFHHSPNKELIPSEGSTGINYGWTGDVKYHFGATKEPDGEEGTTRIRLAHNPSHLEFVNPVVEGFARAAQDYRYERGYPKQDMNKAIPVLIHGDAAFIGEGVVAETLNLSGLPGYTTGGSLHIIANNLLGYTTEQEEGRSTRYASDLAKGFEIPIIHVNADDPIACISAIQIAYEYRQKFHKDFLIDLVGYRRYGHNEMDEPRMTQPGLYKLIDNHPSVSQVFAKDLEEKGIINDGQLKEMKQKTESKLRDIYNNMKENETGDCEPKPMPKALKNGLEQFETAIDLETLKSLNKGLLKRPEGFNSNRKLERILKRRENAFQDGEKADWGTGEALAYASILRDGIPIRLTGQDSERGTFAHRHLVLHDVETDEKFCPMHILDEAKASFDIRNSPLSEAGVLGYEYGYSVEATNTLVIWEAQFGDFANAAQVVFDQFISSSRAKWGEKSNMVMLLPHGYEGQGPEHSSARLERFLQMAAENNWIVAYVTSSAQFFHLLRRQAALRNREEARPLIIMTPKSSLIRNQRIASPAEEFTTGKFLALRDQPNLKVSKKNAKRLLIGSGKIMVDIEEEMAQSGEKYDWLRALRLEQIYPFPKEQLAKEIKQLPNLEEIVWVQEEPKNMGSWDFVDDYLRDLLKEGQTLRYIGRPDRSSPAVGEPNVHKTEQKQIIQEAIAPSQGGDSNE
ncbi:2-oxoglutarate dehydrogenase E1 component [Virgibacillus pantothenticus]|uniref:2-oxoglutarate dehydrogenase E1 component n=1 Tax=Virgibacillus pantothenticus TaxID=1473 RepID=A0A0L0QTQ9_VIRPA|nr:MULTISPECIES: 2-oxoglutarate dehydrogenase E1 component [Virgibacillus]API91134.1 2-oxoglutarate dehydrogenase E1 component [Virgibacillus sp. 6R]KNE21912.1 2-oxoglutarate dehydrogenase [Virgibacillus pantothenticus]MBS7429123.1 2-oxoglutarate dehydrogenase E1 component [Virgibacillus sp. 19R1-5]MBU8566849.1 2-oxoglutarate dehydrogenase E1 component [Virgibacillus pantothenticus]MBU8600458.1 2-oxoglutarate dehydrogenase E1 component [Virgibacillus pantothenticus]